MDLFTQTEKAPTPIKLEQPTETKAEQLIRKLDFLINKGYNATIPAGAQHICVMGYGKGYFKAKNRKANTITSELNSLNFEGRTLLAWNLKDADGYYNFYVK